MNAASRPRRHSVWFTRPGRIVLLACLIGAAPFVIFGTVQFARTVGWVSTRVETTGVVRTTVRDEETKRHYVVVDFTDGSGRELAFGRWVGGPDAYLDGESVRVMYRESSPEYSARIVTWRGLWLESLLLLLLGMVPIVAGLVVFVVTERRIARRVANGGSSDAGSGAGSDAAPDPGSGAAPTP